MTLEKYCYTQDAGWQYIPKFAASSFLRGAARLHSASPLDASALLGCETVTTLTIVESNTRLCLSLSKFDLSEFIQLWLRKIGASVLLSI